MEATMKVRRLRDLYFKTAKRHSRRYGKYMHEDSARGEDARRRATELERYAQELGLKPIVPWLEGGE
jgi:hypothetical protein